MLAILRVIALLAITTVAANAQTEFSLYGGASLLAGSAVSGNDPGGAGAFGFLVNLEDRAISGDGNFGARVIWWQSRELGWGLDLDHSALIADPATVAANGIGQLEIANSSNLVTVNAYRRWLGDGVLIPYVGAGVGLSIPKIEFESGAGTTSRYEIAGTAIQWMAGASIPVSDNWAVFGEYKGQFSTSHTQLVSGGALDAQTMNNTLNVGVTLGF